MLNDSDHALDELEKTLKTVRNTESDFYGSESIENVEIEGSSDKKMNERENSKLTSIESSSEPSDYLSSTTEQNYQSSQSTIITEITPSKEKSSPSVVQIGDRLVIVDHSQSHAISVIKVEEAAGLQRGEDDSNYENDSLDNEDLINLSSSTSGPSSQSNELFSDRTTSTTENAFSKSSENILLIEEASGVNEEPNSIPYISGSGELENSGGGEIATEFHIPIMDGMRKEFDDNVASGNLGIVMETSSFTPLEFQPTIVLMDPTKILGIVESSGEKVFETVFYTEGPRTSIESSSVEVVRDTTFYDPSSVEVFSSTSNEFSTSGPSADLSEELMPVVQKTYIEDDESHVLISPGYGKIPDEFSLHSLSRSSAIQSEDEMMRKGQSHEILEGSEHSDMTEIKNSKG